MTTKEDTTPTSRVAFNPFFLPKWEELHRRLGLVLQAAHSTASPENQADYDLKVREAASMLASLEQLQPNVGQY
jgi:hypothetical protein